MKKRFLAPLLLLALLLGGMFIWYREGLLPVNKEDKTPLIFIVRPGDTVTTIANNLQKEGLIRSRMVFYLVVKTLGIERSIQAGDFRLYRSMGAKELAKALTHGTLDKWVTIVEGLRREEIAHTFAQSHNIPESIFIEKAREGYLFPDTYLIPTTADVNVILSILQTNFEKKITPEMVTAAKKMDFTVHELLTLASLIEREARTLPVKKKVAGVLLNRLEEGMPLQVDATVQYALGYDENERTWWKKNLTLEDLKFDNSYNTYKNVGLPPGPICSPGLDSIRAVLEAEKSPYFYYITDEQGRIYFAETLEEHNYNIEKYLR